MNDKHVIGGKIYRRRAQEELTRKETRELEYALGEIADGKIVRQGEPDTVIKLMLVDEQGETITDAALDNITRPTEVEILASVIAERAFFLSGFDKHLLTLTQEKLTLLQDSKAFAVLENDLNPVPN